MIKRILSAFGLLLLLSACATTSVVAPSGMSWELETKTSDGMVKRESHRCQPTALALAPAEASKLMANPLVIDPGTHCLSGTHRVSDAVYMPTLWRELAPGVTSATIQVIGGYQIAGKASNCKNCGGNQTQNTTIQMPSCSGLACGTGTP
jgi:hypothetical protein